MVSFATGKEISKSNISNIYLHDVYGTKIAPPKDMCKFAYEILPNLYHETIK